ncbi:RNA-directed DNA polymerase [Acinetobacter sp. A3.8]|uniref:RNA-directed DNA polymerase n=1 Tax=Acinetobacter sedimenti TaxID=2919922 RepID=A0A9X1X3I8_9GAMM|nr:RNA-directed DNA polymerase [Acinetobacter sedimenti]MCJ8147251.1 RNA-directed DNA polymerase [Acinetobacter sedimenti]
MKTYIEYLDDISELELHDGLVGYGLFAEKIPNFLCSTAFLQYCHTNNPVLDSKPKDYIRYSSMRNINIPRSMAVPEPFAYLDQIKCLSQNWSTIKDHFRNKTTDDDYKISRIHIRKTLKKPELFEMNYKNHSKDGDPEQDIIIKSKFVAIADISTCFPSIYSHAIAWALVGKETAKQKQKIKSEWFNQLDFYTRNLKHGETNGVLIGPHSSNLISEIILVAVDHELTKKGFKYVRNIDDYTCYVESHEQADQFFICLSAELKKYELSLNCKKSKITPLPQASVKNWVTKLNHFNFVNTYKYKDKWAIRTKELKGFLDFVIELMLKENSDSAVLNYAIRILSNKHLGENAQNYYLKQIHHLVLLFPYLVTVLEKSVFEPHNISADTIKKIADDIYSYGISKNIYEACSYALYWALKYDFKMEQHVKIKQNSLDSLDCIFLMISYLYDKKYNKKIYLVEYKKLAKSLKVNDFDQYWLFIYEILPWSDLTNNYKAMKNDDVSFIKPDFLT